MGLGEEIAPGATNTKQSVNQTPMPATLEVKRNLFKSSPTTARAMEAARQARSLHARLSDIEEEHERAEQRLLGRDEDGADEQETTERMAAIERMRRLYDSEDEEGEDEEGFD